MREKRLWLLIAPPIVAMALSIVGITLSLWVLTH